MISEKAVEAAAKVIWDDFVGRRSGADYEGADDRLAVKQQVRATARAVLEAVHSLHDAPVECKQEAVAVTDKAMAVAPKLRALFADHYWDSFQSDKALIMKHVDSVLAIAQVMEATPATDRLQQAVSWLRRNANAEHDPKARAAFIEAHNAVLKIAEGKADPVGPAGERGQVGWMGGEFDR